MIVFPTKGLRIKLPRHLLYFPLLYSWFWYQHLGEKINKTEKMIALTSIHAGEKQKSKGEENKKK